MDRSDRGPAGREPGESDSYFMGYGEDSDQIMLARTAREWAGFLIHYLKPGMRLLDCGSGPGSITVGLAEVVAPGEVVGIDLEPGQVARARALAERAGVSNVRFEVGSVYELPFPDASFDAAFEANLLEHVREPLRALREMRRVLRPGGVIGVRDPDNSTQRFVGLGPAYAEYYPKFMAAREQSSSPSYAPRQRALLRQAGFVPLRALAFAECAATPADVKLFARLALSGTSSPATVEALRRAGVGRDLLAALHAELAAWPDQPDALRAVMHFAAVGQVPE